MVGHPPKYAPFTFRSKIPPAEILFALPAHDKNGVAGVQWGRALATGTLRLPINSELQVNLRFDGLEHMDQLAILNNCRVACFSAADLDFEDRHIQYLQGFKNLRSLNLGDTLVTDKSLAQIGLLAKLGVLDLIKTNVTGSGFDSLTNLHQLYDFNIEGTNLKPGNIRKIKPLMANILFFNLTRTGLTKQDAAILPELKIVRVLNIATNKQIDNDCVKYLGQMKELKTLTIDDTSITDKSIPDLIKLPKLQQVIVRDKAFWTKKEHKRQYGHVEFVDVEKLSNAPVEVFTPLH
jgi:hypothetical protein